MFTFAFNLIFEFLIFLWKVILLFWVHVNALGTWLHVVLPSHLKSNDFISQLVLFFLGLLISPFPWYTSTMFIFLPAKESFLVLSIFFIEFLFSLIHGVVFFI